MKDFKGICVPLCTPFSRDGDSLDEGALRSHIDWMIESGVQIILACGGTGEFAYLREAEKRRVAEIACKHAAGRAHVFVQTSAINTADTIANSKAAADAGADAIMVLPPYFEGPTMDGVKWHYEKVARAVPLPLVVYNIPQNTNIDITPEIFAELMKIENIQYIKDSTASLVRIQQLVATGGKIFNGGDPIAFQALLAGCIGCIWGAVNAMPREAVELYRLVSAGKLAEAARLWQRLLPAQLFFWTHDYNPSIKAATTIAGRRIGKCRKPLQTLSESDLGELRRAMAWLLPAASHAAQ
ncbi:MAG TPA: dihydrodipicolinate synthase family protein [Dongiaceae bacterium]|jgi:4-hydroxy-tetrahydrodipicolinate synthase|nr:dihydrodipicolinate synthase family protein [Dongiaceae bacterium]